MKYTAIESFHDRVLGRDFTHGSVYPGDQVSGDWLETLSTDTNRFGRPFIAAEDDGDGDERAALAAEATALGISFHPNTGADKLRQKIEEYKVEEAGGCGASSEVKNPAGY